MRSQLDWVQAEMGGNSASVSPRSSLSLKVSGLDPNSPAVDGLVVGTSTDGPAESSLEFEGMFSARFRSDGPAVAQLECFSVSPRSSVNLPVTGLDPDNPAMDGLEVGTCSNGLAAAPMELRAFSLLGLTPTDPRWLRWNYMVVPPLG